MLRLDIGLRRTTVHTSQSETCADLIVSTIKKLRVQHNVDNQYYVYDGVSLDSLKQQVLVSYSLEEFIAAFFSLLTGKYIVLTAHHENRHGSRTSCIFGEDFHSHMVESSLDVLTFRYRQGEIEVVEFGTPGSDSFSHLVVHVATKSLPPAVWQAYQTRKTEPMFGL